MPASLERLGRCRPRRRARRRAPRAPSRARPARSCPTRSAAPSSVLQRSRRPTRALGPRALPPSPYRPRAGTSSRSTSLIRSCSVASSSSGSTATRRWARIGPSSSSSVATCTVHPVSLAPAASASRTACQPLNAGQQARVRVEDPSGIGRWKNVGHDRAEAGHRHEVDVAELQSVASSSSVYPSRSKDFAKPPNSSRDDEQRLDARAEGDIEGAAGPVRRRRVRPRVRRRAWPRGSCPFPRRGRTGERRPTARAP